MVLNLNNFLRSVSEWPSTVEMNGHSGIRANWPHPLLHYPLKPFGMELQIEGLSPPAEKNFEHGPMIAPVQITTFTIAMAEMD